jgi:hypothetical protein
MVALDGVEIVSSVADTTASSVRAAASACADATASHESPRTSRTVVAPSCPRISRRPTVPPGPPRIVTEKSCAPLSSETISTRGARAWMRAANSAPSGHPASATYDMRATGALGVASAPLGAASEAATTMLPIARRSTSSPRFHKEHPHDPETENEPVFRLMKITNEEPSHDDHFCWRIVGSIS